MNVRGSVEGAPSVVVSDGRTVLRTGDDGTFAFEAAGPFVFVCTPSGFATDRWYLPASGELRFELRPDEQPVPFTFVHMTDLHLSVDRWVFDQPSVSTPERFADLLIEIAARADGARFIVATGDQTNDGTPDEWAAYTKTSLASALPIVAIPGNHDHNSVDVAQAMTLGAAYGPGVAYTPYDEHLGPRWFSFEHGGVHFVAIDWTTHHMGMEVGVQEDWVRADLAYVADATPVVFLTHDLMQRDFWDRVEAQPVASLSGHWHTSRVVRDGAALHINTAPATFGGLDYAPAHWRTVTWDGQRITTRTHERGPAITPNSDGAKWSTPLAAPVQRAGLVSRHGMVFVATSDDDAPSGSLVALDGDSGEVRWHVELGAGVKGTPLVVGDSAIAVAVDGETVCVDAQTGEVRWRHAIDDRLRLWCYLAPATDGRRVFVGDTPRFAAIDIEDGSVTWQRDDLGVRGNITSNAHPVVVDDTLLVAFGAQRPDMWGLDPATGATRWPADVVGASLYDLGGDALATWLPQGPVSGFGADPDGTDVYVMRLANRLDRIRASDGHVVWSSGVEGWFNPSTPVAVGDDLFVAQSGGTLRCLDRHDATERWRTDLTSDSLRAFGPYRADGGCLLTTPVIIGDLVVVGCGDGRILWVDRGDGRIVREADTGVPQIATPAHDGRLVFTSGTDGVVRAFSVDM